MSVMSGGIGLGSSSCCRDEAQRLQRGTLTEICISWLLDAAGLLAGLHIGIPELCTVHMKTTAYDDTQGCRDSFEIWK